MPRLTKLRQWSWLSACVLLACGKPDDLKTDLNPEGDPEVTTVSVAAEASPDVGALGIPAGEAAVFCNTNAKASEILCVKNDAGDIQPASAIEDAMPIGYVRVVFDELLDPSIETLTPGETPEDPPTGSIAAADPVVVTCGGETLGYDGFYDPGGNHISFPPGPALVIEWTDPVASGSDCEVTVNAVVVDKDNRAVPADQRGPYRFTLAGFKVLASAPEDTEEDVDAATPATIVFNNFVDDQTIADHVTILAGDVEVPAEVTVMGTDVSVVPAVGFFEGETAYTITISAGAQDVKGGASAEDFTLTFTTAALELPDGGAPGPDAAAGGADAAAGGADAAAPTTDAAP